MPLLNPLLNGTMIAFQGKQTQLVLHWLHPAIHLPVQPSTPVMPHRWKSSQLLVSHTLQRGTPTQVPLLAHLLIQVSLDPSLVTGSSSLLCFPGCLWAEAIPLGSHLHGNSVCALRDASWMISSFLDSMGHTYINLPTTYLGCTVQPTPPNPEQTRQHKLEFTTRMSAYHMS